MIKSMNFYAAVFSSFLIGVATGMFVFRMFFLNNAKIDELVEQRTNKRIEEFRKAIKKHSLVLKDSVISKENEKLIFDYKRVITSDDLDVVKRVDAILDSLHNASNK